MEEIADISEEIENTEVRNSACHQAEINPLKQGWALREAATYVRFNLNQVQYLDEKFQHGETTNQKLDAGQVAKQMRKERKQGSMTEFRFESKEYLTAQQVMSYFSRKAQKKRQEAVSGPSWQQRRTIEQTVDQDAPEDTQHNVFVRRNAYQDDENIVIPEDDELLENLKENTEL